MFSRICAFLFLLFTSTFAPLHGKANASTIGKAEVTSCILFHGNFSMITQSVSIDYATCKQGGGWNENRLRKVSFSGLGYTPDSSSLQAPGPGIFSAIPASVLIGTKFTFGMGKTKAVYLVEEADGVILNFNEGATVYQNHYAVPIPRLVLSASKVADLSSLTMPEELYFDMDQGDDCSCAAGSYYSVSDASRFAPLPNIPVPASIFLFAGAFGGLGIFARLKGLQKQS